MTGVLVVAVVVLAIGWWDEHAQSEHWHERMEVYRQLWILATEADAEEVDR